MVSYLVINSKGRAATVLHPHIAAVVSPAHIVVTRRVRVLALDFNSVDKAQISAAASLAATGRLAIDQSASLFIAATADHFKTSTATIFDPDLPGATIKAPAQVLGAR